MKEEFIKYLNAIGITTESLHKRIEQIYKECLEVCPEEIDDIFVEEYIKDDGSREIENVDFFSENYQFSANNFLTKDNYNLVRLKNKVILIKIHKQNYDLNKATEKSRINIHVTLEGMLGGDLKASKENCDYLKDIFIKYVKPNFKD